MPAPLSDLAPGGANRWFTPLICGVLWGCALTAIETLREPPAGLPPGAIAAVLLSMMASWCFAGVGWAVATALVARSPSPTRLILLWTLGTAALTASQTFVDLFDLFGSSGGVTQVMGGHLPLDVRAVHLLWLNGVFGGLYVASYAGFQRAARSRRRLARLQKALSDQAAVLEEARLHTLRGSLEPQLLLQAVHALKAHYDSDTASADLLLDRLVVYLRAATGGGGAPAAAAARRPHANQAYQTLLAALAADVANDRIPQPRNDRRSP
jgi:hypothetical protein